MKENNTCLKPTYLWNKNTFFAELVSFMKKLRSICWTLGKIFISKHFCHRKASLFWIRLIWKSRQHFFPIRSLDALLVGLLSPSVLNEGLGHWNARTTMVPVHPFVSGCLYPFVWLDKVDDKKSCWRLFHHVSSTISDQNWFWWGVKVQDKNEPTWEKEVEKVRA